MLKIILFSSICLALLPAAHADISVIINNANTSEWSSETIASDVKAIFMGTKEKFSNGSLAKAVDQPEGSSIRNSFYQKIASKDETAMNIYWSNLIFTGKGRPPKPMSSDASIKKYVSDNVSGIGYINSEAVDKTIKVILTIK